MDRAELQGDISRLSAGNGDGVNTVTLRNPTRYEQYRQLRVECGFDAIFPLNEDIWNGFDATAQEEMLRQLQRGKRRLQERAE